MLSKTRAENAEAGVNVRDLNGITQGIIAAAIEVHRHLGPGLLESAYQECLCYELSRMGLAFVREVHLPVTYKGIQLDCSYRIDLLVEDEIIVELKSVEQVLPVHSAQLLTYLKASRKQIGLLINFNVPTLKNGIKRIVHEFKDASLRLSPRLGVSAVNTISPVLKDSR
jgi:GxxExxY protein